MNNAVDSNNFILLFFIVNFVIFTSKAVLLQNDWNENDENDDEDYSSEDTQDTVLQYGLPSFMEVCYRDDPQLNKCIKNVIQRIVPQLRDGVPEWDLPPLDPMVMDTLRFSYKSSMVGGDSVVREVAIKRLSTIKVIDARARVNDPTKFYLEFDAHYDRLESYGKYELKGNIAKIPINSHGLFNITMYDVNFMYVMKGELTKDEEGIEYMKLTKFQYLNTNRGIGSMKLHATNLVERNPFLNMFALKFLNNFWKPISRELLPVIDPKVDKFTTDFFNNIFLKIPYDMLLPKSKEDWND